MRITKVTVAKELKIGLPSYSNITATCGLEAEVGEGESPNWTELWDEINQQLSIQQGNVDPSWIQTKEYKNFFKVSIKQQKGANNG